MRAAAADRPPRVRRIAADVLTRHLDAAGTSAIKLAQQLAAAPYPSIAERGLFALKKLGGAT